MAFAIHSVQKASGYASIVSAEVRNSNFVVFDGRPKGRDWKPPPSRVIYSEEKPWDISTLFGPSALILSPRAASSLRPFFANDGYELLPFASSGRTYTVVNVLEIVDCLDHAKASVRMTGSVAKYAFEPRRFRRSLFKLPEARAGALLVATDTTRPDWSFKSWVERHDLRGIQFRRLWESEQSKPRTVRESGIASKGNLSPSLQVLKASPTAVLLAWRGPTTFDYQIEWSSDGHRFIILDAVDRESGGNEGQFEYTDSLPKSGTTHYRIRPISERGSKAEASDAVTITIPGPAAGDLDQ